MPKIKHIRKIEKKVKPGKTIIKFQEESIPKKTEIIDDTVPTGGVEVAARNISGISKEWKPNEFAKAGDDNITGPDGQTYGSQKDFLDVHARIHGKKE